MPRYWIIVASREHVKMGEQGGFAQACHGKCAPLKRMKAGDGVIYYSSKQVFGQPEPCQAFTAIGQVRDDEVFQFAMSADFVPFRRRVDFLPSREVDIHPMLDSLSFIPDKRHWGAPFRFGMLEIPAEDYERIAAEMLQAEPM